jgi:hypothetical protein
LSPRLDWVRFKSSLDMTRELSAWGGQMALTLLGQTGLSDAAALRMNGLIGRIIIWLFRLV